MWGSSCVIKAVWSFICKGPSAVSLLPGAQTMSVQMRSMAVAVSCGMNEVGSSRKYIFNTLHTA